MRQQNGSPTTTTPLQVTLEISIFTLTHTHSLVPEGNGHQCHLRPQIARRPIHNKINQYSIMNNYMKLVNQHPLITATGYGLDEDYIDGTLDYDQKFDYERGYLYTLKPQFDHCIAYLDAHQKLDLDRTTYYHKHEVERWLTGKDYIPQGVFIIAALSKGYQIKKIDGNGPNVYLRKPSKNVFLPDNSTDTSAQKIN